MAQPQFRIQELCTIVLLWAVWGDLIKQRIGTPEIVNHVQLKIIGILIEKQHWIQSHKICIASIFGQMEESHCSTRLVSSVMIFVSNKQYDTGFCLLLTFHDWPGRDLSVMIFLHLGIRQLWHIGTVKVELLPFILLQLS